MVSYYNIRILLYTYFIIYYYIMSPETPILLLGRRSEFNFDCVSHYYYTEYFVMARES